MPFLKKITGSGQSHSRSGSSSSVKTWSVESPSSATGHRHSIRPSKASKKATTSENRNSVASTGSYGNSKSTNNDSEQVPLSDTDVTLHGSEHGSHLSSSYSQAGTKHFSDSNFTNNDSRKSSGGSVNTLSFDKLILSWDPTDPDEWTIQRVSSWLKFHEFPDSWTNFFKKYQLSGHKFIKLLAYDNFVIYEKYLPQSKNASYTRFQYLLKQTMSKNVTNNHIRQKSADKSKDSRSSSESLKSRKKMDSSQEDIPSSRSASESALSPAKAGTLKVDEKLLTPPLRTHQKMNSSGALYRRSLISLRGSSSGNLAEGKTPSSIKLNIPSRPQSIIDTNGSSTKSGSPPNSPSYPVIFRRHQKSSSSESSLLNAIFGSSSNSNVEEESDKFSFSTSSTSVDHLPKGKRHAHDSSSVASVKQVPCVSEEKSSLWGKWRRRSQLMGPSNSPQSTNSINQQISHSSLAPSLSLPPASLEAPLTPSDVSVGTLTPDVNDAKTAQATPSSSRRQDSAKEKPEQPSNTFNPHRFLLDKKFYPLRSKDTQNDKYILITKDNKTFIPMNIAMINTLEELKDSITLILGINHNEVTIHMTDFGCEIGSALPDETLERLRSSLFLNTAGKLYVKDQTNSYMRARATTVGNDINHPLKSVQSKNSFRSVTNSMLNSNDELSIVTSSSDITSFDDHASGPIRRYPQTPSHYCDNAANSNNGEESTYWNYKDQASGIGRSPKPRRSSSQNQQDKPATSELASDKLRIGTFQILRKEDGNEIDFDKRRESPYVQPELAPKREAPKPPTNASPQRSLSISSQLSAPRLRKNSTKKLPPNKPSQPVSASGEAVSPSSETVVNSYTPGSSHVLVPQPYKGASESSRKFRTEDDQLTNPVAAFISKQRIHRSDSLASNSSGVFHIRSPLLKRGSSRRIVSSASAADVFDENEITFADAPDFSDSEDDGSTSSDDIIWSNAEQHQPDETDRMSDDKTIKAATTNSTTRPLSDNDGRVLERKMTLRPSPEVVYQNLEKFFPHANLDKPVLEGVTPPASPRPIDNIGMSKAFEARDSNLSTVSPTLSPPSNATSQSGKENKKDFMKERLPKRAKTIRTIAHEASEARKQSIKVRRQNTKMWGTRTVEVTDKRMVSINNTKNSRGQYKEFAWIKGEMIGKGSFGAVYLCLNVTTGEMMAVKQVEVPKYGSQNEAIIHTVEALRAEVSTLKNLDHLNIVQYLGFEVKDNINSLFLEYVAGGSVGSLIRMHGKFDEVMIKHLTTQVLQGLSYLHSRGILHRDMKADNLLLDQDGVCKISDFGISRKSKDIYSNSEMTMRGTVFWMAPEMVDTAQGYSAKVDIWSLGCVVLEMFAGKRPWSNLEVVAAMFKIGKSKSAPPIPEDTLPLISQSGRDFLDACFQIDPEMRPTADKLLSHPFIQANYSFDFKSTKLAKLIKSNDKLNSTKLRASY